MRWALNADGERISALNFVAYTNKKREIFTPCCNQQAIFVPSYMSSRRPYFRHHNLSNCPYATNSEYNLKLHWQIVDYFEKSIINRRFRKKMAYRNLISAIFFEFLIRIKRIKLNPQRERMFEDPEYPECRRRTDFYLLKNCFEIQCSPISAQEVKIREVTYQKNQCECKWILGFNGKVQEYLTLIFPYQAKGSIQQQTKKYLKKKRKGIIKLSNHKFKVKGLLLKKWQIHLIKSNKVVGIYYGERLFLKFKVDTLYTHVPKLKFSPAYRKIHILKCCY
jgi:competence CoiA-like predicted nuclease